MKKITLKAGNYYQLDLDKVYYVIKGKLILREFLPNGKYIKNECPIESGEVIGNMLELIKIYDLETNYLDNIGLEIELIEDTVLEVMSEADFLKQIYPEGKEQSIMGSLLKSMLKKSVMRTYYHMNDKKTYILSVLKTYADSNGYIVKKSINYEIFNLSRSQFYVILNSLKKDKIIKKMDKYYKLDLDKVKVCIDSLME